MFSVRLWLCVMVLGLLSGCAAGGGAASGSAPDRKDLWSRVDEERQPLVVPGQFIGALRLDMTIVQIRDRLGAPSKQRKYPGGAWDMIWTEGGGGIDIFFSGGSGIQKPTGISAFRWVDSNDTSSFPPLTIKRSIMPWPVVRIGVTTRQDIERLFGQPTCRKMLFNDQPGVVSNLYYDDLGIGFGLLPDGLLRVVTINPPPSAASPSSCAYGTFG